MRCFSCLFIFFLYKGSLTAQSVSLYNGWQFYQSYFDQKNMYAKQGSNDDNYTAVVFTFPIQKVEMNIGFFGVRPSTGYSFKHPETIIRGNYSSSIFSISPFIGANYLFKLKPRLNIGIGTNFNAFYTKKSLLANVQITIGGSQYVSQSKTIVNQGWQFIPEFKSMIVYDFKRIKKLSFITSFGYIFGHKRIQTVTVAYTIKNQAEEKIQTYINGTNFNVGIGLKYSLRKNK
jgi:hemolysin activation/secretion protein